MSTPDAILERLLALHPKLIDLGLSRIERLLAALGHPERRLPPVIHVAGTNGKGSTIAFLRAALEAAGKSVHVYTSPHLVRFNERIRLAGTLVSDERLAEALAHCERVNDGAPITLFEITTATAFHLFAETPADYLLLEVGLGGRFDATNVIDNPLGTVITPVSIDHVEYLGPDLAGIAREKAGILKRGAPAVIGVQTEVAREAILAEAERLGVVPLLARQDFDAYGQNGRLVYQDEAGLLDLPLPRLAGPHQIDNAGLAIAAIRHFALPVGEGDLAQGLSRVDWPARLMPLRKGALVQGLGTDQELWLDGGHNAAGGAVLVTALAGLHRARPRPLVLIWGTFANKDAAGFLAPFGEMPHRIFTVPIIGERAAWAPDALAELARGVGLAAQPAETLEDALEQARAIPDARIVICGSLHLAGEVLEKNETPPE
ncbi:bifunctional folylpolyglutamate synthase/dihydrofolate synthase [Arsenicitalea aurantiaca]|uniref:tetrahydrofolate synthase n=1 Tax=Arsenicitalea aurantiaca TaxID=1783274 RepID=A0A433X8D6_9HYPH|nr:folylpolyglutamate synthase/dihydrofolate synthase family protein [Arsenicitalea aurantiaca]RUT30313.1 bifunctional folylpolyglutamate synthase/dihydrofolate synthase [Arsenicitalea aurantiaca]